MISKAKFKNTMTVGGRQKTTMDSLIFMKEKYTYLINAKKISEQNTRNELIHRVVLKRTLCLAILNLFSLLLFKSESGLISSVYLKWLQIQILFQKYHGEWVST